MLSTLDVARNQVLEACKTDDILAIECFLFDGEDLSFNEHQVFQTAITSGSLGILNLLLAAEIIPINKYSGLFLNLAVKSDNLEAVNLLLSFDADPELAMQSALELAGNQANFKILEVILQHLERQSAVISTVFLRNLIVSQEEKAEVSQSFIKDFAALVYKFNLTAGFAKLSSSDNLAAKNLHSYLAAAQKMSAAKCSAESILEIAEYPEIHATLQQTSQTSALELESLALAQPKRRKPKSL